MKTINMVAETIQEILLGIQQFASAFNDIGGMTSDAMKAAREQQAVEFTKQLEAAK
jgi:hypothetical protein